MYEVRVLILSLFFFFVLFSTSFRTVSINHTRISRAFCARSYSENYEKWNWTIIAHCAYIYSRRTRLCAVCGVCGFPQSTLTAFVCVCVATNYCHTIDRCCPYTLALLIVFLFFRLSAMSKWSESIYEIWNYVCEMWDGRVDRTHAQMNCRGLL